MALLAEPEAPDLPVARHGAVVTPPAKLGDPFTVLVPDFDDQHVFEIRRWESRALTIPAAGDEVLVIVDDQAEPWVSAWWPADGDVPLESATSNDFPMYFESAFKHGMVADGETDDTAAIQAALDTCHAAGGGHVLGPPAGRRAVITGLVVYDDMEFTWTGELVVSPTTTNPYPIRNDNYLAGNSNCRVAGTIDGNKANIPGDRNNDTEKPNATIIFQAQNEGAFCRNIHVDVHSYDAKRLGVAYIDVDGGSVRGTYERHGRDAVTLIGNTRNIYVDYVANGCGDDGLGLNAESGPAVAHDLYNIWGRVTILGPGDDGPGLGITVRGGRDINIDLFAYGIDGWGLGIFDAYATKARNIKVRGSVTNCGGDEAFYSQAAVVLGAGVIHTPAGSWAAIEDIDLDDLAVLNPGDIGVELKSARGAYGSFQHIRMKDPVVTDATTAILLASSYMYDIDIDDPIVRGCENGIISTQSVISLFIRNPNLYNILGGKGIHLKEVAGGALYGATVGGDGKNGQTGIVLEGLIGDWLLADNLVNNNAVTTPYDFSKIGTPTTRNSVGRAVPTALPIKVEGSRGGNAALAGLLKALEDYGVIDDATEA